MGHRREAELQALYGGEDPLTLISSRSGRKRDKKTALRDRMSGMLAGRPSTINERGMPTDAPVLGSYQKGTLEGGIGKAVEAERAPLSHARSKKLIDMYRQGVDWKENPEDKLASRFITGRGMGKSSGTVKSTIENLGYEGLKALSQALGLKRVLGAPPGEAYDIDETTSPASWSNALAAQAGIMSDLFYPDKLPKKQAGTLPSYQKGTLGPIAARMAKERGLEFAEGRNPGSMFFKGPAGEKMALQHGDEFLDLVSVGGGKSGRARDLFEMLDELGTEGGSQVRWDTRHATPSGQRSLEKAISKGRLARNPAGAGWLSTAQKAGKRALKGAVGGVSALLDPYFGAIQDPGLRQDLDPELQGTLDQILGTFGGGGGEGRPQG